VLDLVKVSPLVVDVAVKTTHFLPQVFDLLADIPWIQSVQSTPRRESCLSEVGAW